MFPAAPGGRHHLSAAELRMSHDRPDFGERHSCDNNKVSPPEGGGADDMPPAYGSSTVAYRLRQSMDPEIAADLRPPADGSAVRTSLVAGGG